MKKLSKNALKNVNGGAGGAGTCTATVLDYRTGDQFETPWNIKRQGLMRGTYVCEGEEALNNEFQKVLSCICN
jgi:bacteriocin-like protein